MKRERKIPSILRSVGKSHSVNGSPANKVALKLVSADFQLII